MASGGALGFGLTGRVEGESGFAVELAAPAAAGGAVAAALRSSSVARPAASSSTAGVSPWTGSPSPAKPGNGSDRGMVGRSSGVSSSAATATPVAAEVS